MTAPLTPDQPSIASLLVREIARGTGFTTIAMIGEVDGMVFAATESLLPVNIHDPDYGRLIHTAADLERRHPLGVPVFAVALVLPERDIAYLHDSTAPTNPALTLTVGPNPHDDAATEQAVRTGLAALMQAATDNHPTRPSGRPFTAGPNAIAADAGAVAPHPTWENHNGYHGRHRG